MESEFTISFPNPIGSLYFVVESGRLLSLSTTDKTPAVERLNGVTDRANTALIESILSQLKKYFSSAISFHTIPLAPEGSSFQKSVWNELQNIPLGETRTYGEIAKKLHSSAQAVGNACRSNPIQLIIPCHRVISAKGLGGYAGETAGRQLAIKHWLLNHEGIEL